MTFLKYKSLLENLYVGYQQYQADPGILWDSPIKIKKQKQRKPKQAKWVIKPKSLWHWKIPTDFLENYS